MQRMPPWSANVPAHAAESPDAWRARAATIRGHARMFPDDRAGRTLLELADELDARANEIEAKEAARKSREASRSKRTGFFHSLLTNARRAAGGQ